MDGTLTEARQKFNNKELENHLYYLTNRGVEIGIVTGSGLNYLNEQMGLFLKRSTCRYKTHLLPCNGTKHLRPPQSAVEQHNLVFEVSMEDAVSEKKYRDLVKEIIGLQYEMTDHPISLTGHFIDYRGSMINWCPIGRDSSSKQRSEFVMLDNSLELRRRYLNTFKEQLSWLQLDDIIEVKLGGDTSFDIYPKGWDKTFSLKHFSDYDIWFVGDRCKPSGNDYELFTHCGDQGFESKGPEDTVNVIKKILQRLGEKK